MHARRFSARTLRSWGIAAEADTVLLVVSELVTNALVHTQGAVRVELTLAADRLRVTVSDSSPRAPAKPVVVDWESTGGRGLFLVEAVSAAWGSVPVGGGKQVWSEIVVTRPEADTDRGTEPDEEPEAEPEEERKPGRGWGRGRDRSWGLGRNRDRDRRRSRDQSRHRGDDRAAEGHDDRAADRDGEQETGRHGTDRATNRHDGPATDRHEERTAGRKGERTAGRDGEQAVGLDRAMEHIGDGVADPPPHGNRPHEGGP
jgi:hypothetical protein